MFNPYPHDTASPVWQQFERHANDYDAHSALQQASASHLVSKINLKPNQVFLDAGCGTGILAKTLNAYGAKVWAIDLSTAMLKHVDYIDGIETICADMTDLPFPDAVLDGVVSNFSLHWAGHSVISELLRVVRQGGELFLAIPVFGSLSKVQQSYPQLPIFNFEDADLWINQAGETLYSSEIKSFQKSYPQLKELLIDLKKMGGAQLGDDINQPKLSTALLKQWFKNDLTNPHEVILNYEVLFLHLIKPIDEHNLMPF